MTAVDHNRLDRIAGTFIGLACGDALGAGYEFGDAIPYGTDVTMCGGGPFKWPAGHWTDDTDMALAIALAAREHGGLHTEAALDSIVLRWVEWAATAADVGSQTRAVLSAIAATPTAAAARAAAAQLHERNGGMSAGNGSLMRTAPVALAFLDDVDAMWTAAQDISALTHYDREAGEACALWCYAIRHAVREGTFEGMHAGLDLMPPSRRDHWIGLITEAENSQPWQFPRNGWVRHAFQAAWCAIATTPEQPLRPDLHIFPAQSAAIAIERAVRAGRDTDTVAAIAGSLVGARWGLSGLPTSWTRRIHGTDGLRANHLQQLAVQVSSNAAAQSWPEPPAIEHYPERGVQAVLPSRPELHLLGQQAMRDADLVNTAVISLSRVGVAEASRAQAHVPVFIIDREDPDLNPNLHFSLWDVARTITELLADGAESTNTSKSRVVLHCVQAQNRTPTFAAAYLVTQCGYSFEDAVAEVKAALPHAEMADYLLDAVRDFEPTRAGENPMRDRHSLQEATSDEPGVFVVCEAGSLQRTNATWVEVHGQANPGTNVPWQRLPEFDEVQRSGVTDEQRVGTDFA